MNSETLRQQNRERGELLKKLLIIQEEERKHIARELHDDTGQSLTSLMMGLKACQDQCPDAATQARLNDLRALAQRALEDLHRLSINLRPTLLDDLGLPASVNSLLNNLARLHPLTPHLSLTGLGGQDHNARFDPLIEVVVYRVIQEALANIGTYADARHVWVDLTKTEQALTASVRDDGCGFEPGALAEQQQLGILGMQERMLVIGGQFTLQSSPGNGTMITICVPLKEEP